MVVSWCPHVAWQFQIRIRFPTVKQGLILHCQKAIDGVYFTKKWRAETLQPGLEFDNFKPRLESGIFKCISWLNGLFFGGWWWGFSERGSQDLSNGTHLTSYLANYLSVFTSTVYSNCNRFWLHRKKLFLSLAISVPLNYTFFLLKWLWELIIFFN